MTEHPTAQWTAQQVIEAFPWDEVPRYLLRDRDRIYGDHFRQRIGNMGIEEVKVAPHSPWQNPYVERLIRSIRRECLNNMIVLNEQHLQRALSLMSNFFAGLALFLSGLGLYGLLSSSVAQRTSEIGVRMALGAERGRVLHMILSEGLGLLAGGLVLGALVLTVTVRFVEGMLYGVSAFEPIRLAVIMAVLALVAIVAGLLPALRAASIDPILALRGE